MLTLTSVQSLAANQLAELLSLMIRSEEKPGGPYIFGRENDMELNAHLVRLFAQEGTFLEGAARYAEVPLNSTAAVAPEPPHDTTSQAWASIRTSLLALFSRHLKIELNLLVDSLEGTDKTGEISQLSRLFASSLSLPLKEAEVPIEAYDRANQYAWLAYSLYDSLLDAGQSIHTLPLANHCLTTSVELYSAQAKDTTVVRELFSQLNIANAAELSNRNILTFNAERNTVSINQSLHNQALLQLTASRSIAHIIGPLLCIQQLPPNSFELETVREALTSYCQARQLLDDLHDWKQDIAQGQITYVVARLLEDANITIGIYAADATMVLLDQSFFNTCLLDILDEIDMTLNRAVEGLLTIMLSEDTPFIRSTIHPLRAATLQARKNHTFDQQFLKDYRSM